MTSAATMYFEETGSDNTEAVLAAARKRADELGIDTILVATTSGSTAIKAAETFSGKKVVAVTHYTGFSDPNEQQVSEANQKRLAELGVSIQTATHVFGAIGASSERALAGSQVGDAIAHTLRMFGQGTKVTCEIAAMAADAGLTRTDEDVISIAGSSSGADTAIVVQPANTSRLFDMKVREIICKPRL